jgi:predicted esterase
MPYVDVALDWKVNYRISKSSDPRRLILLLHGFREQGAVLFSRLRSCFREDDLLLAPDAPFPAVMQTAAGLYQGFSWYFFDAESSTYLTPMEPAVRTLRALVERLQLSALPKWVVGYSQGGYLAPFIADRLERVERVVGLNCRFRDEALRAPLAYRLDGLHGALDETVDPERARRSHAALTLGEGAGEFHSIAGNGHEIGPAMKAELRAMATAS